MRNTNNNVLDKALNECIILNLFSANVLRDVASELARRQLQTNLHDIESDSLSERYQSITAVERSVESYLQVLGGKES